MQIRKIFKHLLICVFCVTCLIGTSYAANNMPHGDVGDYGNWITVDNMQTYNENLSSDAENFQKPFQTKLHSVTFVPLEVKIGLSFMKALSSIDSVLQMSLVRFVILFLFIMYAFWIGLEAYKLIRDTTDYKKTLYDIFINGMKVTVWVIILLYGPAKLFTMLITPIISLGISLSDFILNAVAQSYDVVIPNTCETIHQYVNANATKELLISPDAAADIMCLPARLSVYFYHATATAFEWMITGFKSGLSMIIAGAVCVVLFIRCIFKYAFMTLGVAANLFLTLLMLPFTAIAEAIPKTKETNYVGQIFSGLLAVFKTKKLSEVISVFINAAIYFVSLSIVISICAALLKNIVSITGNDTFNIGSAMMNILCASIIFHFANKADTLASDIGGKIDNSFGEQLSKQAKQLWSNVTSVGGKIFKAFGSNKK